MTTVTVQEADQMVTIQLRFSTPPGQAQPITITYITTDGTATGIATLHTYKMGYIKVTAKVVQLSCLRISHYS